MATTAASNDTTVTSVNLRRASCGTTKASVRLMRMARLMELCRRSSISVTTAFQRRKLTKVATMEVKTQVRWDWTTAADRGGVSTMQTTTNAAPINPFVTKKAKGSPRNGMIGKSLHRNWNVAAPARMNSS